MKDRTRGVNKPDANDSSGTERLISYCYSDDFVISSDASPGAWISSTRPMLDIDQMSEQEVA